jgi:hypothetical protein
VPRVARRLEAAQPPLGVKFRLCLDHAKVAGPQAPTISSTERRVYR